ncbi:MAG: C13 family peptidase [Nitrospiria bacterium]
MIRLFMSKRLTAFSLLSILLTGCASLNFTPPGTTESCEAFCQITLLDGSIYEGRFKEGLPHGHGTLLTTSGDHYVGNFANGLLDGEGVYTFSSGSKYTGDFKNGTFFGYGMLTRDNGDKYVGAFENNRFHGNGILTFVDDQGVTKTLAGVWTHGRFNEEASHNEPQDGDIINPEVVLFYQYQLLTESMRHIEASREGTTDLYFLSFGGDSHQDVFMNEALYTTALLESSFGLQNRTLYLINHPSVVHEVPIASVINLRVALQYFASQMNVEEDVLFLYLTSHGSENHTLTVSLGGVPLVDLPADELAEILRESGIKWKVVTISACYSGGFIDYLKDEYSMIITSSRADRTSFDCRDDSEMTYFGRAFFQYAMTPSASFVEVFSKTRKIVSDWEDEEKVTHSEPQIHTSPLIEKKLEEWRLSLVKDKQVMLRSPVLRPRAEAYFPER